MCNWCQIVVRKSSMAKFSIIMSWSCQIGHLNLHNLLRRSLKSLGISCTNKGNIKIPKFTGKVVNILFLNWPILFYHHNKKSGSVMNLRSWTIDLLIKLSNSSFSLSEYVMKYMVWIGLRANYLWGHLWFWLRGRRLEVSCHVDGTSCYDQLLELEELYLFQGRPSSTQSSSPVVLLLALWAR